MTEAPAQRFTVLLDYEHTSEGGCDDWIIIDETKPKPKIGHNPVCRCYEEADARMIAELLNAQRKDITLNN